MIQDIEKLLNDYVAWVRDKTSLREVADSVEITTPYLDRHNDYVQIYAKRANGSYLLTDDGNTIDDLEQSGCKLESPKRQDLLRMTLKRVWRPSDKIPKSRHEPERIVKVINRPNRETAQSTLWAWDDTKEGRAAESRAFAFLNDADRAVPADVLDAFRNYAVRPILWSRRDEARDELAA